MAKTKASKKRRLLNAFFSAFGGADDKTSATDQYTPSPNNITDITDPTSPLHAMTYSPMNDDDK